MKPRTRLCRAHTHTLPPTPPVTPSSLSQEAAWAAPPAPPRPRHPGDTRPSPGASAEQVRGSPRPTRTPRGERDPAPPGGQAARNGVWGPARREQGVGEWQPGCERGAPRPRGAAPGPGCGVAEEINASCPWRGDMGQRFTWPGSGKRRRRGCEGSTLRFPRGTDGAGPWWILAGAESGPGSSLSREPESISWAGTDCGGQPQSQACPQALVLHILAPLPVPFIFAH